MKKPILDGTRIDIVFLIATAILAFVVTYKILAIKVKAPIQVEVVDVNGDTILVQGAYKHPSPFR